MAQLSDLPEPWWDLRPAAPLEDEQREALQAELFRKITPGHILHGRTVSVVARSQARDDVLVAIEDDDTWALVHLTWRSEPEVPPWPMTTTFGSLSDAIDAETPG
jgi:hypothetical protein